MPKAKNKNTDEKYNIICLSNQLWDFPNWTNKRHVMSRMAKLGHNVLFVDPPINSGRVFFRQIWRKYWGFMRVLRQFFVSPEGVLVYTPINIVPLSNMTSGLHINRIRKLAEKNFDENRKTVLWIYHVQIKELQKYIDELSDVYDILIYDCVDNYAGFPVGDKFYTTSVSKEALLKQEKELTAEADIVFATAPGLVDRLKQYNENVHYTPNVGDYTRFKNVLSLKDEIPEELVEIPRPRIGYIGALDDYKFDYALVKKAAEEFPSYQFIIIGPRALADTEVDAKDFELSNLHNVHLLGTRPYDKKEYYLAGFDVELIPYVLNDYTVGGCFPVKFHDSLAAGLPVVVTDLPAYAPFKDVCYISKTHDEFCANIKRALEENIPDKIRARQEVAKQNDWDGKVAQMLGLIATVEVKPTD